MCTHTLYILRVQASIADGLCMSSPILRMERDNWSINKLALRAADDEFAVVTGLDVAYDLRIDSK